MADQQGKPAEPVVAHAAGGPEGRREGESQHSVDPMANDPLTHLKNYGAAMKEAATEGVTAPTPGGIKELVYGKQ